MNVLLHPTYFPNVITFAYLVNATTITLEKHDNYQKQTYRNRCAIATANGRLELSIPVIYSQKNRQLYKDIKIYHIEKWQNKHWKTIQIAYKNSPFFEYYEHDLEPLFKQPANYLFDFNLQGLKVLFSCLELEIPIVYSTSYATDFKNGKDLRFLVNSKSEMPYQFNFYTQVFMQKNGFISNLSILDVLFNEGPNTIIYLNKQFAKIKDI